MAAAPDTSSAEALVEQGAKEIKNPTPEQLQQALQQIDNEISFLIGKISDLDQEKREHELVLSALEKVPDARRCCRMVGGILAERTVKEVRPQVKDNKERIDGVIGKFKEDLEKKGKIRKQFVQKYNLNQTSQANPVAQTKQANQQAAGVLV
ncbi:unnamed protein product [Amoebophrya sp. A25]|nr:unnamed protein product [Amoebophrya sp. A25]|eukprot:GSA25T00022679001.1